MDVQIYIKWKDFTKNNEHGYSFKLDHMVPQKLWYKIQDMIEKEIKLDNKRHKELEK